MSTKTYLLRLYNKDKGHFTVICRGYGTREKGSSLVPTAVEAYTEYVLGRKAEYLDIEILYAPERKT